MNVSLRLQNDNVRCVNGNDLVFIIFIRSSVFVGLNEMYDKFKECNDGSFAKEYINKGKVLLSIELFLLKSSSLSSEYFGKQVLHKVMISFESNMLFESFNILNEHILKEGRISFIMILQFDISSTFNEEDIFLINVFKERNILSVKILSDIFNVINFIVTLLLLLFKFTRLICSSI